MKGSQTPAKHFILVNTTITFSPLAPCFKANTLVRTDGHNVSPGQDNQNKSSKQRARNTLWGKPVWGWSDRGAETWGGRCCIEGILSRWGKSCSDGSKTQLSLVLGSSRHLPSESDQTMCLESYKFENEMCMSLQPSIIMLMCFAVQLLILQQCLGRLLFSISQHDGQIGQPAFSESQRKGGKKSISLINLVRLATLARLIWINNTACSFSSACCPQFNFDLLIELAPVCLAKFVSVDGACLAS